jgi:hypothetical protein
MDTTGIPTECLRIKNLAWASNGQKLAYYLDFHVCEPNMVEGPFLADLSCTSEPINCTLTPHDWPTQADSGLSIIARQSGSRFLAIFPFNVIGLTPGEYLIHIFDTDIGELVETVKNPIKTIMAPFLWSSDGEWFAVKPAEENAFYLISAKDGEATKLYEDTQDEIDQLISWITIPYPATPGDAYTITEAGHDLNLRADPSLAGEILLKLQPGDGVTVLEGPVTADGYTWWKLQADDGMQGWAVNIPEWYSPVER